jgi:TPR repeat protein
MSLEQELKTLDFSKDDPQYFYDHFISIKNTIDINAVVDKNEENNKDSIDNNADTCVDSTDNADVTKNLYNYYFMTLLQAANLGHKEAIKILLEEYDANNDKKQDFNDELINFYLSTADYKYSGMYLGNMYYYGLGVNENKYKAKEIFSRWALENDDRAQNNLGNIYCYGINGKEKDFAKALELYKLSAAAGNKYALGNLGNAYRHGSGVPSDYKKAKEYYKQAAELGNDRSMVNLAILYSNGRGCRKNEYKAKLLFKQAAEKGNIDALYCLGNMYYSGYGVTKKYDRAFEYFSQAYERGHEKAAAMLSKMYSAGIYVTMDKLKAIELLMQINSYNGVVVIISSLLASCDPNKLTPELLEIIMKCDFSNCKVKNYMILIQNILREKMDILELHYKYNIGSLEYEEAKKRVLESFTQMQEPEKTEEEEEVEIESLSGDEELGEKPELEMIYFF